MPVLPLPVWRDLAPDHGVLELRERDRPLELHLLRDDECGITVAWWTSDDGVWLGAPVVGSA